MQSGIYVGISSQIALERRLTTVADNIANMNTVGFRGTEVKFDQVMSQTKNDLKADIAFVTQGNDYLSTRNGELIKTGNPLDFAVKGEGWFAINTPAGQVMTRDGRFSMSVTGELVSTQGYPVLDAGGGPIQLNPAAGEPTVGTDGRITQNGAPVAQLGLFSADATKGFVRYENSGVIFTEAPQPIVDNAQFGVLQAYVEQSNVNAISQMTQLVQVNRAFEGISSLMKSTEDSFSQAIRTLGGGQ
ncbi:flagellar basal-body rod protein FlgF [Agrobacterium sp. rho-13.3]|jgi:flagellar basal-body rod protein FlgF|uniref:flagellar basal-body rod protein FlgF n=1 Tax=Agrobacterium sp. rho-13.3 TaxID=3072980 RepID=UPI002A0EB70B|nr:flagellar basal-body rod protein FlgF [Agrobacterium sp. rho-13.3]MDX8310503.1 flagellar basal-body rod protein FlgF [Agrobacterium sp. rho-13.3]